MAKKILVTSGKGGVGKSTVTALLGASLANLKKETIIIELDFGLRSLDIILGVQDNVIFDLGDVLKSECELDEAILTCEYAPKLKLISASLDSVITYNKINLKNLIDELDKKYEYILIDSPAGLSENINEILSLIDEALIVVTPDLVCVRDGCKVSEILCDFGVKNQRLVINKVKNKFIKLDILPDLDYVIDRVGVQLIAVIPEGIDIMKVTAKGTALSKDCQSFKVFNNFGRRILGETVPLLINNI